MRLTANQEIHIRRHISSVDSKEQGKHVQENVQEITEKLPLLSRLHRLKTSVLCSFSTIQLHYIAQVFM